MTQKLDVQSQEREEMYSGTHPNHTEVERFQIVYEKDNIELTRLGKRPVLKVGIHSIIQSPS